MKFLFASDSFKGTLTSRRTAELLAQAAYEVFPACKCACVLYVYLLMADGGEGTTEAVIAAAGGSLIEVKSTWSALGATDKLLWKIGSQEGGHGDGGSIRSPAGAFDMRDPRKTTTFGTGEMIRDALDRGFRDILLLLAVRLQMTAGQAA